MPFSPSVVFALVGPRPVVRASSLTTVFEIAAASSPPCGVRSLIPSPRSLHTGHVRANRSATRPAVTSRQRLGRSVCGDQLPASWFPGADSPIAARVRVKGPIELEPHERLWFGHDAPAIGEVFDQVKAPAGIEWRVRRPRRGRKARPFVADHYLHDPVVQRGLEMDPAAGGGPAVFDSIGDQLGG